MKAFSLPKYCRDHKLGYRDLADLLQVSESYACQLRAGKKPLTLAIAFKLSKKLGLSLDSFFNDRNRTPQPNRHLQTKQVSASVGKDG